MLTLSCRLFVKFVIFCHHVIPTFRMILKFNKLLFKFELRLLSTYRIQGFFTLKLIQPLFKTVISWSNHGDLFIWHVLGVIFYLILCVLIIINNLCNTGIRDGFLILSRVQGIKVWKNWAQIWFLPALWQILLHFFLIRYYKHFKIKMC